jgi:hypothetical protein
MAGPGTLLVYDEAFPRATAPGGVPIRNTPIEAELRDNKYPAPYKLLPIKEAAAPEAYFAEIAAAAKAMGQLARLIIFGHGRVVNAAEGTGTVRVTTGIIIGAKDITALNANGLDKLAKYFAKDAQAELWVCEAAATGTSGGISGVTLCQALADALTVPVLAAAIEQQYDTVDQQPIPGGGWQSNAKFLPWEGTPLKFKPRNKKP